MKWVKVVLAAVIIGLLVSAWGMWQKLNSREGIVLTFSEAEIEEKLAKKFPRTKIVKDIIPVTVRKPEVTFVPGSDRVRISLHAELNALIKKYEAKTTFTCALRYEPKDFSLRLMKTKVENVEASKLPEKYHNEVTILATLLAREYLDDYPIYHLKDRKLKDQATRLLLKEVTVNDDQLEVRLGL